MDRALKLARWGRIALASMWIIGGSRVAFAGEATAPAHVVPSTGALPAAVGQLADPDPAIRRAATAVLAAAGDVARPLLLAAMHDPDPQVRATATALLAALPLSRPTDAQPVRELLDRITAANADPDSQSQALAELSGLPDGEGAAGLVRVLVEAVPEALRWQTVDLLRFRSDSSQLAIDKMLRQIDTAPRRPKRSNVPLLVACGRAWAKRNTARGEGLMRAAAAEQMSRPGPVPSQMIEVFEAAVQSAEGDRAFDEAARLLRFQADGWDATPAVASANEGEMPPGMENIAAMEGDAPPALQMLALEADHGLQRSVWHDLALAAHAGTGARAALVYAAAEYVDRHAVSPLLSEGLACNALAAGLNAIAFQLDDGDVSARWAVASWLVQAKWATPAHRELEAIAAMTRGTDEAPNVAAAALSAAAQLDVTRHDYAAAAAELSNAIELSAASASRLQAQGLAAANRGDALSGLRARQAAAALAVALANHDDAAARSAADDLLSPDTADAADDELIMDVVPRLRMIGRGDEARQLFEGIYSTAREPLDADAECPEAMNNVAWLCARSGERLAEAVKLSRQAIAADPRNAAYLDTAAEAQFDTGHTAEGVRLESAALRLLPFDPFMSSQLRRFKAAAR